MFVGTSLIPNNGNQTQKIPPIISVKESKVNSAAGIALDPIEYKIKPIQTKLPWTANNPSLWLEDIKALSLLKSTIDAVIAQNIPANATVVNFGVSFLHLNETEKTENPIADTRPNIKPLIDPKEELPIAIITTPMDATNIAIQTLIDIFSFKNKNPNNAVIKGIAARHNNVIATVVLVIDEINVIIALPRPMPPTIP